MLGSRELCPAMRQCNATLELGLRCPCTPDAVMALKNSWVRVISASVVNGWKNGVILVRALKHHFHPPTNPQCQPHDQNKQSSEYPQIDTKRRRFSSKSIVAIHGHRIRFAADARIIPGAEPEICCSSFFFVNFDEL